MKFIIALVFCVFMGMTGISLGLGTVFPPINLVAQPFVCPDGEMDATTSSRRSRKGASITEASWTCEDPPGKLTPISGLSIAAIAGSFYGLLMFLPIALLMALASRGRARMQGRR